MSTHKEPLSELERAGLEKHGLPTDRASQLSDSFLQGLTFALSATGMGQALGRTMAERDALVANVEALEEAGEDLALEVCSVSQERMEWSRVLNSAPKNSISRRDLIKQAEVSWHEPTIQRIREMCEGLTGNQIRHALDGMLESAPTPGGES